VRFENGNYTNLTVSELVETSISSFIAIGAGVTEDRVTICDVQKGSIIVKLILAGLLVSDINISSITEAVQKALDESEELRTILGTSFNTPTTESVTSSPTSSHRFYRVVLHRVHQQARLQPHQLWHTHLGQTA